MKSSLFLLFIITANSISAQKSASLTDIDEFVKSIDAAPPADLAYSLTRDYVTETQKVRAIFSWIAGHIDYKTKRTVRKNPLTNMRLSKPVDSLNVNSADEFVAESVIRNQSAVCEGYARLFKTLCENAGIKCVLVTGYARGDSYHFGARFFSNHYWNAVYADSAWHLIDVTWASGYFTYYGDEFVKSFDDYYFFTPPELFIHDHFPDDLTWTLLPDPPVLQEFYYSPFKQRAFIKYNIYSLAPKAGVIQASVGDTLRLALQTSDEESDKRKSADTALLDSNMLLMYSSAVFLQPEKVENRIRYSYIVADEKIKWLHLMYNGDVILRYRLNVKKRKSD